MGVLGLQSKRGRWKILRGKADCGMAKMASGKISSSLNDRVYPLGSFDREKMLLASGLINIYGVCRCYLIIFQSSLLLIVIVK